ncbi:MAG: hypothetical protein JO033_13140, partial [Acidobacteriaceae bacterium]|nr:hypothetical protein [Acidobacteriaceae bacterium]
LAADSNGNYTFIQTDYVQYDITLDGAIKIGAKTYTMASSYNPGACDRSNAFHLVVVNRENPDVLIANNSYCTAQYDAAIAGLIQDLEGVLGHEDQLVFIASNGHPIPTNWDFYNCTNPPATCQAGDGDARIQRLANDIARLGGYFETMVYLTPKDTYSLVGAPPPPIGTPGASNRARESSSVYPDSPTGELHGVLARGLRGNWYSPLDADPTGQANLGLYNLLAQAPVPFPLLANKGQLDAFQYISNVLCDGTDCNVRNQYSNTGSVISTYLITLTAMSDPSTNTPCPDKNPTSAFCIVRSQLLTELRYVATIRAFNDNLNDLWATTGTVSIFKLLDTSNTIIATLKPPPTASVPNLVEPIVSFFLGLASELPVVGRVAGIVPILPSISQ